mgnify:FL=1
MKTGFVAVIVASLLLLTAQAQWNPKGLLIYRKPPGSYTEAVPFTETTRINRTLMAVRTPGGRVVNLAVNGILAEYEYPDASRLESPEAILYRIEQIRAAMAQYPQVRKPLEDLCNRWENALNVARVQQKRQPGASQPSLQQPTPVPRTVSATPSPSSPLPRPESTPGPMAPGSSWENLLYLVKKGKIGEALEVAGQLHQRDPSDGAVKLIHDALHQMEQALEMNRAAEAYLRETASEIERLLRNAEISAQPTRLTGYRRLESARGFHRKAAALEQKGQTRKQEALVRLKGALETVQDVQRNFAALGIYDGAIALAEMAAPLARQNGIEVERYFDIGSLRESLLKAEGEFAKAKAAFSRKQVAEAQRRIRAALDLFPGYREAAELADRIEEVTRECFRRFETAKRLEEEKRPETALAEVAAIQAMA